MSFSNRTNIGLPQFVSFVTLSEKGDSDFHRNEFGQVEHYRFSPATQRVYRDDSLLTDQQMSITERRTFFLIFMITARYNLFALVIFFFL